MNAYPRDPGSSAVAYESDWNRKAPFGICPACGSVSVEDSSDSSPDVAFFQCSDRKCFSVISGMDEKTGEIFLTQIRTKWYENRPLNEWKEEEYAQRFKEEFIVEYGFA